MLRVKNLVKKYSDLKVLDNINFRIDDGEVVSIIGPNGSGKTTLLNLISGLDKDFSGVINHTTNAKFGFVFQNSDDSVLPWKTVIENIHLHDKNLDKKRISKILRETNLWKFRNKYPYQLSGGMKQLLAISRAFIHECNFIILDEPFSSLDCQMASLVRQKLMQLYESEKPTVIIVSHNLDDAILLSDRIVVLSNRPGKIKGVVNIGLQRPRMESAVLSNEFLDYKREVAKLI